MSATPLRAWVLLKSGLRINLAASEAFHVVGWSLVEIRDHLGIELEPLQHDPVGPPAGLRPWEPWPSRLAAARFTATLRDLGSSGREK